MYKRFFVAEMYICTFNFEDKFVKPNYWPTRTCVVDNEKEIVIDIEHELKYDYIKTINGKFILSDSMKKIKEGTRAAIIPIDPISVPSDKRDKAYNIVRRLENGEEFRNGNEVLSNEEYLDTIKNIQVKTKTISKIFKKVYKKVK